ncbi:MAG: hypothetical protein AAF533_25550 [Acidobacteriota bacterium]
MKRSHWLLVLGGLAVVAGVALAVTSLGGTEAMRRNDAELSELVARFDALPRPPRSRLLASEAEVGLFVGMGNHCDFYVGQVWCSELSPEELARHHEGLRVLGVDLPLRGGGGPVRSSGDGAREESFSIPLTLRVAPFEDGEADAGPSFFHRTSLAEWDLSPADCPAGRLYLVHVLDDGHDPRDDLRCH